jgi:hypothetical protein
MLPVRVLRKYRIYDRIKAFQEAMVVSFQPSTEEIGAMGREIKSLRGIHRVALIYYIFIFIIYLMYRIFQECQL